MNKHKEEAKRIIMIRGIMFSVQHLILISDQPTIAKDIMKESGLKEKEFLFEQKLTGYENKKIIPIIKEAFNQKVLKEIENN